MKSLTLSIDSQAPTQADIDAARTSANQALKDAGRRKRLNMFACLAFATFYLVMLATGIGSILSTPYAQGILIAQCVVAVCVLIINDSRIAQVRAAASETLKSLTTLNFTEHPKELVEFVDLATSDADIRSYQHQIASMGRLPVLGEFHAAKQWCSPAEERRTLQAQATQANEALAKLAYPI